MPHVVCLPALQMSGLILIACFILATPLAINTVSSNLFFIEQHLFFIEQHLAVLHVCGFAI